MYFAVIKKKKLILYLSVVLASIIILSIVLSSGIIGVFGFAKRELPIYRVKREDKKIAISFDCAWGVDYTDTLLSIMDSYKVKCTFFMVEFWVKKYPEYLKKISDAGHETATHSATHPHMASLDKKSIKKELVSSVQAIENVTGKKVELFRAPYGEYNDLVINTAKSLGLYTIQWDVDSLDWKDLTESQLVSRVTERVKDGSIVLFHNQGLNTHKALGKIIDILQRQGYEFVPIGELIYKENYYINVNGEQIINS